MILEAKYVGQFPAVTVPGFSHKMVERGETVKLRIAEASGKVLPPCWEITKGKTKYNAYVKDLEKARADRLKAASKKKADAKAAATKRADAAVEAADASTQKPDEKGKKT